MGNYELMIFLTPTIVSMDTLLSESEKFIEKLDHALTPNIQRKFDPEVYQKPAKADFSSPLVSGTEDDQ